VDIHTLITIVNIVTVLLCGLIWLVVVLFLRLKKRKSFVYLLFFTIFYVYIIAVLNYTIFQFQSLFLLNYLSPNHLMLKGNTVTEGVNLIPLVTLRLADIKTSLLNVLMLVPFGFGLPFITKLQIKRVIVMGTLFSVTIELLQLLTGAMAHMTFRTADINDVLFNTAGAAIGYALFIRFRRMYRHHTRGWKIAPHPVLRYIAERPQEDVALSRKTKKIVLTMFVVTIAALALSYAVYPQGDHKESAITQSGDPCGGTHGNGQIVSIGNNEFTIKRNNDESNQIIHLTSGVTIKTSNGPVSLPALKIGDRVTLVGGPNRDTSFTADTVAVCSASN
jgi:glycopeptide antibiotics resistance protein